MRRYRGRWAAAERTRRMEPFPFNRGLRLDMRGYVRYAEL